MKIPFNKPYMTGKELFYIAECHFNRAMAGDGPFTKRCHAWLESRTGASKALLTHSCTAALEMAAQLTDIKPGDEVIMPSYTFVSTANAFVMRGAKPVFVDIRRDTLNLDERLVESAVTDRTRVIAVVHYAGVACAMDEIMSIARRHDVKVVEDAAQGILSTYRGRQLGSIGHLGTYSFHETKNIISGEGGCLLANDAQYAERAEIIREKGTDRSKFFRGQVDKYTWQELGSSYLPGELIAAFLWAQLEEADLITRRRVEMWAYYNELLQPLQAGGRIRLPTIPAECGHNGHMFYVILGPDIDRDRVLARLKEREINAVFHYVPLHSSPAGIRFGRSHGSLPITDSVAGRLIRLPLWMRMSRSEQEQVASALGDVLGE